MDEGSHIADRMRAFAEQLRQDAAAIAAEDEEFAAVLTPAIAALESDAELYSRDTVPADESEDERGLVEYLAALGGWAVSAPKLTEAQRRELLELHDERDGMANPIDRIALDNRPGPFGLPVGLVLMAFDRAALKGGAS